MVVPRLEMWIMNPKISRPAQELMVAVAMNCTQPEDVEVLAGFLKLRLKTKPNVNLFLGCVRELIAVNAEVNLPSLVKLTIFNELSNSRNPNNMAMLNVMFATAGHGAAGPQVNDLASASLAAVFVELLLQKDCYLRALRALLREVVRVLRFDSAVNLHVFSKRLLAVDAKLEAQLAEFEFRERFFTSVVDLVTLSTFLGVTPAVRDAMTAYLRGDKKDYSPYKQFLRQAALIQQEAVVWMCEKVMPVFKPDPSTVYPQSLHKLLFMANSEEYWKVDGWPSEGDRGLLFKAASEIPLLQDTLLHLFVIGINKQLPLNGRDTIDIAECLVKRAAVLHPLVGGGFPVLAMDKVHQLMECLFQLARYNHPESIALPVGYTPPTVAISNAYWKVRSSSG